MNNLDIDINKSMANTVSREAVDKLFKRKKLRIFITGIAGFLGSHLAERFLAEGHEVRGCDNMIGGDPANIPSGAIWSQADCGNRKKMFELLQGVDVVYHCACTAYEGLSVFSPHLVTRNTFDITMSVVSAAIARKVKRFVFCSSMARYGTQATTPFTEDMIPKPQDPYGIAKYASELALRELCETHGVELVIAVPHNIIGPRQKYDDPYRNVASIFINLMLQDRAPVIYGNGLQQRCFSYIDDVVEPLAKMALADNVVGEIINVGPDEGTISIAQLAGIIAGITGFKRKPVYMEARPREVSIATCSADKARKLLGYEAKTSLNDGLLKMVEWIKQKGVRKFEYHLPLEIVSELTPKTWKNKLF